MEKEIKEIECNVTNCIYNKDACKCLAGHIQVGTNNACTKDETRCGTFSPISSCKDSSCCK